MDFLVTVCGGGDYNHENRHQKCSEGSIREEEMPPAMLDHDQISKQWNGADHYDRQHPSWVQLFLNVAEVTN